jgi:ferredoxin
MMRVRLLPRGVELQVPPGTRLLDALDDAAAAGLPTACRAGNCGLCLVRVLQGEPALAPARSEEGALCTRLGDPGLRLGCQLELVTPVRSEPCVLLEVVALTRSGTDLPR